MMNSHKFGMLIGLLLVAFLLVSCQANSTATSVAEEKPVQDTAPSGNEGAKAGEPIPAPGYDTSVEGGSEVGGPQPEPRTELSATNPGSVDLASGRVTLVEFFAFW